MQPLQPLQPAFPLRTARGFTLMEVIIAIGLLALISAISWRGLDGMLRTHESISERSQRMDVLQTSLAQWSADLNNAVEIATLPPLDWDGKALRITRHTPRAVRQEAAALQVVAWADRQIDGQTYLVRWQSPPLHSRQAWNAAWQQAKDWAHSSSRGTAREAVLLPMTQWQIYYSREGHWVNPYSSAQTQAATANTDEGAGGSSGSGNNNGSGGTVETTVINTRQAAPTLPEGIRLRLQIAPTEPTSGWVVTDWLNPTQGSTRL